VSYINPIRLYIFVSFVFFFTAFAITKRDEVKEEKKERNSPQILARVRDSVISELRRNNVGAAKDSDISILESKLKKNTEYLDLDTNTFIGKYHTLAEYDSAQAALPEAQRDAREQRWATRRSLYLMEKYHSVNLQEMIVEELQHNGPKVMFLLLPLFALFLKGMYNWKRWYYADHAIFSIHVHSFWFLLILVTLLLGRIFDTTAFNGWGMLLGFVYLVAALHNTYQQGWRKSFLKAGLLSFAYFISIVLVMVGFALLLLGVIL
ncbi:MAG TPA: hypothetical protein VGC22_10495, partial [Chitinophaga sp.]